MDSPVAIGAYINGLLPTTAPGTATGWEVVNAFTNLTFVDPLSMTEIPGTGEWLLVGKNGQLWRFANDPTVIQSEVVEVLDWRASTETSGDQGFYSAVCHPNFGQAGEAGEFSVFVCYNYRPVPGVDDNNRTYWRVSRFTWLSGSGTLNPASEEVLINQYDPQSWHNGGAMFFGDDGFLYISCGDGGGSGDAYGNSQRIDQGFFSGVFRIDVDNDPAKSHPIRRQPTEDPAWAKPTGANWPASSTQGYGIPNDNPWLDPAGGVLEEFYAIGLRSPHSMHFDSVTGDIWIGDVGQGTKEEMTRVTSGSNAQWAYREGLSAGPKAQPASLIGTPQPPDHDYDRGTGTCIIGGMRYRGARWNEQLGGKVIFGDHVRGRVWTMDPDVGSPSVDLIIEGFDTGAKAGLGNFCTDAAGEIYLMNLAGTDVPGGTIMKLEAQGLSTEPPQWLSQTGVFSDLSTLEVEPGVIPYDVASPLWSDAAAKRRWIILPNDGSHDTAAEDIAFSGSDNWVFPAGTVFVKHFEVETAPGVMKRLETRLLVCTEGGGKYGVTYKWNTAGTDAELLTGGLSEAYDVVLEGGGTETRSWDYPSRADCMICHNDAAGQALGFRTHQLNRNFDYDSTGRTANQLVTLNALGMFDRTLGEQELRDFIEARPLDDGSAPLEHRVRSYLDANCSHCHRPGGQVSGFDARLATPLHQQNLVDGLIEGFFYLGPDGRYIRAGDPSLSAVHVRLAAVGDGDAMPPLAKNVADDQAVATVAEYISGLNPPDFEPVPAPIARYVRLTALSEVNGNPWTSVAELRVLDASGVAVPVSVHDFDSEELADEYTPADFAVDGDPATIWHTQWGADEDPMPHHLTLDLGSLQEVGGYEYVPRQAAANGRIANYEVHHSSDGSTWTLMDSGTWANDGATRRFDDLVGRRPARSSLAGPSGTVGGTFEVTVVFDMDVDDFDAGDVSVTGGSVMDIRGAGYYYVATVLPSSPEVSVQVVGDAVDPEGEGSFASNILTVGFVDTLPPVPSFSGVPSQVSGAFEVLLGFGEEVTGLEMSDLAVTNGTLDSIVPVGFDYRLTVTPVSEGGVTVEILPGSVIDLVGNVMGAGASVSTLYLSQRLWFEAESADIVAGFEVVSDPSASAGAYLWTPQGLRTGFAYDPGLKVTFNPVVPRAGDYRVRGMTRSDDASSDSFYLGFDGEAAPDPWHTNQDGNVGTGLFHLDIANSTRQPLSNPSVFTLSAGAHVMELYARDDGTRIDTIWLESVRPLSMLAGPAGPLDGPFTALLEFSEPVTGLTPADFQISGGAVTSLAGGGSLWSVEVAPVPGAVTILLPENVVTDSEGQGNHASNPYSVVVLSAYQQWAIAAGVDPSEATLLADEDGDGVVKLLEFAFGLDPAVADYRIDDGLIPPSGFPRVELTESGPGGRLQMVFLRRRGQSGLTYVPEFGNGLSGFEVATGPPSVDIVDADWERVTVSDTETVGTAARRFGRVRVTLSP
ncbi:fibronectin type III domain-containing protein [Haloferula helveola]|uniref:Fibronectin type III domain-containing protein n=1 Tax=Haloferula helveola TaxID=490095 RepID=A0ABM7RHW7_9BACT|nr:fibronectin type III domain-containing protein [Haloferula helveola]